MRAVHQKTGESKEVWFPRVSFNYSEGMLRFLWGRHDKDSGLFVSHCEPEYRIEPVQGLQGCRKLTDQLVGVLPFLKSYFEYFDDLAGWLERTHGYQEDLDLFGFSYDWRQDPTGTFIQNQLNETLDSIVKRTGKKVLVFCHSMGGIVARSFLQQRPERAREMIDQIVTGGTPWNGCSAEILVGHHRGFTLGMPLNKQAFRGVISNNDAMYAVVPLKWTVPNFIIRNHQPEQLREDYPRLQETPEQLGTKLFHNERILGRQPASLFTDDQQIKLYFDPIKLRTISQTGEDFCLDSLESFISFFNAEKIPNSATDKLLNFDENLLREVLARLALPDNSGIQITCLCGTGVPTLQKLEYESVSLQLTQFIDPPVTEMEPGDGLVPLASATFLDGAAKRVMPDHSHSDLRRAKIGPVLTELWGLKK